MKLKFKIIFALLILTNIIQGYFILKKSVDNEINKYKAFKFIKENHQNIITGFKTDTANLGFMNYFAAEIKILGGSCTLYSKALTSDYVKVQVTFKGKSLFLENYHFNGLDYASNPGCFNVTADGVSMINYIKIGKNQKAIPFDFSLRSIGVLNNDFEYNAVISEKDGKKVVAKFPGKEPTLKGKIQFLKYPVVVKDTIQLTM